MKENLEVTLDLKQIESQAKSLKKNFRPDLFESLSQKEFPHSKMDDWNHTSFDFLKMTPQIDLVMCQNLKSMSSSFFPNEILLINGCHRTSEKVEKVKRELDVKNHSYFDHLNAALSPQEFTYKIPAEISELDLTLQFISDKSSFLKLANSRVNLEFAPKSCVWIHEKWLTDIKTPLFANVVVNLEIPKSSKVFYVRAAHSFDENFYALSQMFVNLKKGAQFHSYDLIKAPYFRQETSVNLLGSESQATLSGLTLSSKKDFVNLVTNMNHRAPNCSSNQNFKSLVLDSSQAVFKGGVTIDEGAQKIDSNQIYRGLPLSSRAQIFAKPQLNVNADDVKATHGFATQALDPEQMFYMVSRGLDVATAQKMFLDGFCQSVYGDIFSKPIFQAQILPLISQFSREVPSV